MIFSYLFVGICTLTDGDLATADARMLDSAAASVRQRQAVLVVYMFFLRPRRNLLLDNDLHPSVSFRADRALPLDSRFFPLSTAAAASLWQDFLTPKAVHKEAPNLCVL
jgi:hypothetical protein